MLDLTKDISFEGEFHLVGKEEQTFLGRVVFNPFEKILLHAFTNDFTLPFMETNFVIIGNVRRKSRSYVYLKVSHVSKTDTEIITGLGSATLNIDYIIFGSKPLIEPAFVISKSSFQHAEYWIDDSIYNDYSNSIPIDVEVKKYGPYEAYSRTNRILNEVKSQGNIVCFRNLKSATDKAITLFSNKEAIDVIVMQPFDDYVRQFNQAYISMLQIAPTVNSVNDLQSEEEELEFIKAFRELMRIKNVLGSFTEFSFDDISMDEQQFEDYKSKYLDLYDKTKSYSQKEKVSILNDVDFELKLIHRDEVNVSYILKLLAKLKDATPEEQEKQKQQILEQLAGDAKLRSKRELIEKFIRENLPHVEDSDMVEEAFVAFWDEEKRKALDQLSTDEKLDATSLDKVIGEYLFTEKKPMRDDVVAMMQERPSLRERASMAELVTQKILEFVAVFILGIN